MGSAERYSLRESTAAKKTDYRECMSSILIRSGLTFQCKKYFIRTERILVGYWIVPADGIMEAECFSIARLERGRRRTYPRDPLLPLPA